MVPVKRTLAPLVKLRDLYASKAFSEPRLRRTVVPMKICAQAVAQDCLEPRSTTTVVDDCESNVFLPSDGLDPAMDMYFSGSVFPRGQKLADSQR
jgi:hypothetical protein